MKKAIPLFLFVLFMAQAKAQYKVAVIGSSTAQGTGAALGNGFVDQLANYYSTHTFINRALGGTTTYTALATAVPGKPAPDPTRNITYALSLEPDVILVSYPSNDVANGYTNEETMNNLKSIEQAAVNAGVFIYFVGNQPRDFTDPALRTQLNTQNELLKTTFPGKTIDVYPSLVGADGYINPDVSAGDGIHVNDEGHRRIFSKVVEFNIFQGLVIVPVTLTRIQAELIGTKTDLSWQTATEQNCSKFIIERSSNGMPFTAIGSVKAKGNSYTLSSYRFADSTPVTGVNNYRLQILDLDGKITYSKTVVVRISPGTTSKAFPNPASDAINYYSSQTNGTHLHITVLDMMGSVKFEQDRKAPAGINSINIPLQSLPRGQYILSVMKGREKEAIPFLKY